MNKFWSLIDKNYFPKMGELATHNQILKKLDSLNKSKRKPSELKILPRKKTQRKTKKRKAQKAPNGFNLPVLLQPRLSFKPNPTFDSLNGFVTSIHSRGILNRECPLRFNSKSKIPEIFCANALSTVSAK